MLKTGRKLLGINRRLLARVPNGFSLLERSTVDDLKLNLTEMKHTESGARWLHIDKSNEKQKIFNICFRTVPMTDNGVAHILEHIVLCGSKKYPVRDPFFKMINRSLNNFMNAMTGLDYTMYPFSTMNENDFQNLLSVYLDAVFRPNLRYLDFLQEAWRIGEGDIEDDVNHMVFKGVVFNEMKGAMGDREQVFFRRLIACLGPSGTYRYNSGGEPLDIPSLTYEELQKFHADHYNPANAHIFTYGDVDLENTSKKIIDALSSVPSGRKAPPILLETPWSEPRHETFPCPWNDSATDPERQSSACVAWLLGDKNDVWNTFIGYVIGNLLCDGASSPLYKVLIESGLGSEYSTSTGFNTYSKNAFFSAGLKDAKVEDLEKIHGLVISGIESAVKEGYTSERIDAMMHQLELATRHQSVQFGLHLSFNLLPTLLHGAGANESLQSISLINKLKAKLAEDKYYLSKKTKELLLDNTSSVFAKMIPQKDFEETQKMLENDMLEEHLSKLTADQKNECLDIELDLEKEQMEPPNISCLPTVYVSDIPTAKEYFIPVQTDDRIHYKSTSGSGLTYIRSLIELDCLSEAEIKLLPLYESVLTQIGRGGYDYREVSVKEQLASGGFSTWSSVLTDYRKPGIVKPVFNIYTYGLDCNIERIKELLDSLLVKDGPDFNPERIKTITNEVFSSIQGGIISSGHHYSMRHSHSYINKYGAIEEQINGLTAIQNLKEIINEGNWNEISQKLKNLHEKISDSYIKFLVHSDVDQTQHILGLEGFKRSSPKPIFQSEPASTIAHRSTWDLGFPINFVSRVFPTVAAGHEDSAPLRVLAALMGSKYLLREIRESGGAYGAGAQQLAEGFRFFSYRDPAALGTLSKFSSSVDWVLSDKWESRDVSEAILKVFQSVDAPISQSSLGVGNWKNDISIQDLEKSRAALLSATGNDLRRVCEKYLVHNPVRSDCIIGPLEALISARNQTDNSQNELYNDDIEWKQFKI